MRIIDGNTIETDCDSCACTFTCGRGEDGEPDEILCSECKQTWQDLRAEIAKERDRVWLETFLSFPFKALPAPEHTCETVFCQPCFDKLTADLDWADQQAREAAEWRQHQDLMDAADQAAYYSPEWREE